MRALVLVVAGSLALAGCQTTKVTAEDAEAKAIQAYQTACDWLDVAYLGYQALKPENIKPGIDQKVHASYAAAKVACLTRPTNMIEGAATVLRAVDAFKSQLKSTNLPAG